MPRTDYQAALAAWQVALQQFEQADPDHVDEAIHRLRAAELRLAAELKRIRREVKNDAGGNPKGYTKVG